MLSDKVGVRLTAICSQRLRTGMCPPDVSFGGGKVLRTCRALALFFFFFFTQHSCPLWYRPKWCKNQKTCRNVIFQLCSRARMAGGGKKKATVCAKLVADSDGSSPGHSHVNHSSNHSVAGWYLTLCCDKKPYCII